MKKKILILTGFFIGVTSLSLNTKLNATCNTIISSDLTGVLIEEINTKKLKIKGQISSIKLEIDLEKKDVLAKIERDASKEMVDFTERKNDLEFFKDKYKENMYAKEALVRIEKEEKDLMFMHEKYLKSKEEKIKRLMDESYIPENLLSKGKVLLKLKKQLEKLERTLKINLENYEKAVASAKKDLKASNEMLLKEIELIK